MSDADRSGTRSNMEGSQDLGMQQTLKFIQTCLPQLITVSTMEETLLVHSSETQTRMAGRVFELNNRESL